MAEYWFDNPRRRGRVSGSRRRYASNSPAGLGGTLMLANRRRKSAKRKSVRAVRVRHVLANPRGGESPAFLSGNMMRMLGYGTLGALAPTLVTDQLLPRVGLTLTGIPRRIAQLAVPTLVGAVGGSRFLGPGFTPFMVGAYAVTGAGLIADLTGGAMLAGLARYAPAAPGLGRYEASAPQLAGR